MKKARSTLCQSAGTDSSRNLFQPIPPPKKPTLPTKTVFPGIVGPVWTEGKIQQQEIRKPILLPDFARMGDFTQAQSKYHQEYQDWRINEGGRQAALGVFERQCQEQGAAGLVRFARVAGSLEIATKIQWFKNGLQRLQEMQEVDFGTPAERAEARKALKALREMFPLFPLKHGPANKLTTEEAAASRQASNYKAGTKRNNRQAAQRLVKKVRQQEQWYLDNGQTGQQARREAVRYVFNEFKATSRAKDKDAILVIFLTLTDFVVRACVLPLRPRLTSYATSSRDTESH